MGRPTRRRRKRNASRYCAAATLPFPGGDARSPYAALILTFAPGGFASAFARRLGASLAATGLGMLALAPWAWLFVMAGGVMGLGFFMLHNSLQAWTVSLHAFHFFIGQSIGSLLLAMTRSFFGFSGALLLTVVGLIVLGMYMASEERFVNQGRESAGRNLIKSRRCSDSRERIADASQISL
jgi:hypothetical protein